MTCIVAMAHAGVVHMAGDSMLTTGEGLRFRTDMPKVWVQGEFIFGGAGTFRPLQLLRHRFKPPEPNPREESMAYLACGFTDALRDVFSGDGWTPGAGDNEPPDAFREFAVLMGYHGLLYGIDSTLTVHRFDQPFVATGAGAEVALGAMHALHPLVMNEERSPRDALIQALEAAETYIANVGGPFTYDRNPLEGEMLQPHQPVPEKAGNGRRG